MNREETFWEVIDALAQAYTDGTLSHGSCHNCAVGNLAQAAGAGLQQVQACHVDSPESGWFLRLRWTTVLSEVWEVEEAYDQPVRGLPYTRQEISEIEAAFEARTGGTNGFPRPQLTDVWGTHRTDDWELDSLLRVVDVLMEIHDYETPREAQNVFESVAEGEVLPEGVAA